MKNQQNPKVSYRIQTANGCYKYAGTGKNSWFTLKDARNDVDYNRGERIVEHDGESSLGNFLTRTMKNQDKITFYHSGDEVNAVKIFVNEEWHITADVRPEYCEGGLVVCTSKSTSILRGNLNERMLRNLRENIKEGILTKSKLFLPQEERDTSLHFITYTRIPNFKQHLNGNNVK